MMDGRERHSWVRIVFSIVVLLIIFLFLFGCGFNEIWERLGVNKPTEKEAKQTFKQITTTISQATTKYHELVGQKGNESASAELATWLRGQGGVKRVGVGSGCVWYQMDNGTCCVVQTDDMAGGGP
jgi:hypothetical protein